MAYSAALLLLGAAIATASVIPVRPERRLADQDFLKRQKQVLDLYVGIGHNMKSEMEHEDFDFEANAAHFTDEKYPTDFHAALKNGLLPQEAIFSLACHHTRHEAIMLFDVLFFAKDFETFHKVASYARRHVNPGMFGYAYTLALIHRDDCQSYTIPPMYEVLPNFFLPSDTLHRVYDAKMQGEKEGVFTYNNTGYEYSHHDSMFGGLLSRDNRGYGDFRISYLREDIGQNSFVAQWTIRNPSWLCAEKYNRPLRRRGENFYYFIQQNLARYTLERIAWGLPYAEIFEWRQPIKVGYNPRLNYLNGQNMYARADNMIPSEFNLPAVVKGEKIERRIIDVIDAGAVWELSNKSVVNLDEHHGIELLGRMIYGTEGRPSKRFYPSLFYSYIDALAYLVSTASDRSYVGNAMSTPMTISRDPVFYNVQARLLKIFQHYKKTLGPYKRADLIYNGVTVKDLQVDKFVTYFDNFDYEVTNGVPMSKPDEYTDSRYSGRQYRLNHKPYHYNISLHAANAGEAMVRIFLGPQRDSDDRLLSMNQRRLAFVEIDRFPIKMAAGDNVIERSSKESPMFVGDQDGFRTLYNNVNNAIKQQQPFYISEAGRCGMPDRLQLPVGWEEGFPIVLSAVVSPYDRSKVPEERGYDIACGGSRLYDGRAMGYPFDRPINEHNINVPNIIFRDTHVYYREEAEVNRPAA